MLVHKEKNDKQIVYDNSVPSFAGDSDEGATSRIYGLYEIMKSVC